MKRISRTIRVLSVLFALFFLLSGCTTFSDLRAKKDAGADAVTITASIAKDGSAWIPCKQFSPAIHIKGDIREAYLTADRDRVVVLEESGKLYTAKPAQLEKRTTIAQNARSVEALRDDGIVYTAALTNDEIVYYRYMFRGDAPVQMDLADFICASDTCSLLYCTHEGAIMRLSADGSLPAYMGQYNGTIDLVAVSNDSAIFVLSVANEGVCTTYLYDSGECQKLFSLDMEEINTQAFFSADQEQLVVIDTNSTLVFLKKPGEDAVEVEMPMLLEWEYPMTESGWLTESSAADTVYLIVETENYGLMDLYAVNMDGEREKVLGNIHQAITKDGRIYYIDEDNTLFCAELDGANYADESKISSNVYSVQTSPDGESVCYSKNLTENGVGSLYIYLPEKDESTRVTTNASFLFIDLSSINSYYIYDYEVFSSDGKYLYYFEDVADVGDGTYSTGSLMRFRLKDGETKTVLVDSMIYVGSERADGAVSSDYFWTEQYFSGDSTQIRCDLLLYEKDEKISLAQGVLHMTE